MRTETTGSEAKQYRGIRTITAKASSLAKETEGFSTADTSKAYSNRRSEEDK